MTTVARVTVLDLRTIAPNWRQAVVVPVLVMAVFYNRPEMILPALAVLYATAMAGYPFQISDRSDLDTLYAVLPLTRRALLFGRYAWALAVFVITAAVGIPVSLLLAAQRHVSISGFAPTAFVASWALFALSVSIQYPMFVRFGHSRTGMAATTLPIFAVSFVVLRAHLDLKPNGIGLVLLAISGVALLCASVAVAITIDPRRAHVPIAG